MGDLLTQSLVLAVLLLFLVIGFLYKQRPKTITEYALGSKNINTATLTATMVATCIGGGSLIGASSSLYQYGIWMLLALIILPLKNCITALVILPRWSKYYGCSSIAEVMERMYGKYVRIVVGIAAFIFCIGSLGAQIKSLHWVMEHVFKENSFIVTIIALFIILAYASIGGVSSVIKTDVMQWAILIIIIPAIAYYLIDMSGGITTIVTNLPKNKLSLSSQGKDFALTSFILWHAISSLNPLIIHRFLVGRNTKKNQITMYLLAITSLINLIFIACIAFIAVAKFPNIAPKETIFAVIQGFTNTKYVMTAFVIALIAAITSTADSVVNTGSIILINDISTQEITEKQKIKLLQISTIILGIASIIIAFAFSDILEILWFFGQYYSIIVAIPLIAGLFLKELRKEAFWSSISAGLVVSTVLHLINPNLGHTAFVIAVIVSLCVYFITFFIVRDNKLSQQNFSLAKIATAINKQVSFKTNLLPYITLASYFYTTIIKIEYGSEPIIAIDTVLALGILGFCLFFEDSVSKKYKGFFILSILWYCFAFFPIYFFLTKPMIIFVIINLILSLITLAWLINWHIFITFLLSGTIIAISTFCILHNEIVTLKIAKIIYLGLFISCIGITAYIFAKKGESISQINSPRKILRKFTKSLTAGIEYQTILLKGNKPIEISLEDFKNNVTKYFYRLLIQRNVKLKFQSNHKVFNTILPLGNFYKIIYSTIFNILYFIENDKILVKFYCNKNSISKIEIWCNQYEMQTALKNPQHGKIKYYKEILQWRDIPKFLGTEKIKLQMNTDKLIMHFQSPIENNFKGSSISEGRKVI
ncbi:MAG: sodium:solute symporter family protein [Rickettsiales bacterium]|nr:sodium:solute symporter family protein [Rickettsiales bacterium]